MINYVNVFRSIMNLKILDQKICCLIVSQNLHRRMIFVFDVFDNTYFIEFDLKIFREFHVFKKLRYS